MTPTLEQRIQTLVRAALAPFGTYFRINVGKVKLADGRWFDVGTPKGYSDITGWTTLHITPEMLGKRIAVFTAVEVKTPTGKLKAEQAHFLTTVKQQGGIALVARSEEEVQHGIQAAIAELSRA